MRRATLFVSLVPRSERDVSQKDWERRVIKELKRIPDARIDFSNQSGAGGGRDVNLYVVGSDPVQVNRSAQKLVQEMRGLSEVRDPRINADMSRPEILIRPRLDLAAQLGVTVVEHQPDGPYRHARRLAAERGRNFRFPTGRSRFVSA